MDVVVGARVAYTADFLQIRGVVDAAGPQPTGVVVACITVVPHAARVLWTDGFVTEVLCKDLRVLAVPLSGQRRAELEYDARVEEVRTMNYQPSSAEPGVAPLVHLAALGVDGEAVCGATVDAQGYPARGTEVAEDVTCPECLALWNAQEDESAPLGQPTGLTPQGLTLRDWQDAIQVQDASNLSGVVHSLAAVMSRVMADVRRVGGGTPQANQHPLVYLYVNKLADLSGQNALDTGRYHVAYIIAKLKAAPEELNGSEVAGLTEYERRWREDDMEGKGYDPGPLRS